MKRKWTLERIFWRSMGILENIYHYPREFIYSIKNLIYWFPVIWGDYWYGQGSIYRILEHKLRRMARMNKERGQTFHSDRKWKQMLMCAHLLKRIREENYREYEYNRWKEKWGESSCPVCGEWMCKCFPVKGGYAWVNVPENVKTARDDKFESLELRAIFKLKEKDIEEDLDLLFNTMRKRIRGWWD
jgi:hypothetical protein